MPSSLLQWVLASETIGQTFNNNQPECQGISCHYVLPEPALFANYSNEESRQVFIKTYLKLCELLLYEIKTCGSLACLKSPQEWQRMMGLELFLENNTESREAKKRNKTSAALQEAASIGPNPSMVRQFISFIFNVLCLSIT